MSSDANSVNQIEWIIAVQSWIIQDGNYDDFYCEQVVPFAITFHTDELNPVSMDCVKAADLIKPAEYLVRAEISYCHSAVIVLDFGLRAYAKLNCLDLRQGGFVTGAVKLSVDPYDYKEYLAAISAMPDLLYRWRINRIEKLWVPWIRQPRPQPGEPAVYADLSKLEIYDVERTDASSDEAFDMYYLHCSLLGQSKTCI